MDVNPGELDKRITIVKYTGQVNSNGFRERERSVVKSCWAKMTRASMAELVKNGAEMGETSCRFLIRTGSQTITRDMCVEYAGNAYEIQYVNDYNDDHEYTEIAAIRKEPGNGKV